MIKLERPAKPQVLVDNAAEWTRNLMSLVAKYKEYKKIPEKEKEAILKYYRHPDIKEALRKSSFDKCAFCEGIPGKTGFAEIEHFYPKSDYTDKAFEWDNLLYSCKQCNNNKLSHDTMREPIINPYDIDPQGAFTYQDIMIYPVDGPLKEVAKKTIEVCGLADGRLFSARADVLVSLRNFESDIQEALNDYKEADTDKKRSSRIRKINNALGKIDELIQPQAQLSAYCKHFLDNSVVYRTAKETVDDFVQQHS
ncbi:HNH endonuclease [Trabulsiella odontotermitis]|uniref:HNH endonuclease n=1 Tax=Trabulsiella odontotermitis TaxID=379893 RepID=UPI0006BA577B|nr:HNH endonuclease [Trabulsiella odontotermitis]